MRTQVAMHPFQSILVDLDATAAVHPAFAAASDLASRSGARLTVVDVVPDLPPGARELMPSDVEDTLVRERRAALEALARTRPDVAITAAVLRGRSAIALVREVLRAGHDLVVRSHARDLVPGRPFGPVDTQLLRKCPCPVWLIGPEPASAAPHVLAAVDVESDAPEAGALNRTVLDLALTIARLHQARVTALHAWSLFGEELLQSRVTDEQLRQILDAAHQSALRGLTTLVASVPAAGVDVRAECRKGEPERVIPAYARQQKVDIVVMGTVGRSGVAGFLMGNTAEKVLRDLRGSILAVKPPGFVTPVTLEDAPGPVIVV